MRERDKETDAREALESFAEFQVVKAPGAIPVKKTPLIKSTIFLKKNRFLFSKSVP